MDTVVNVGIKPSELALEGITETPAAIVETGCCSCLWSNKFSRCSQATAAILAIGAIAVIIILSVPGAQANPEAYVLSIGLIVVCVRLFFSEKQNIDLGGYALQNGIYTRNNEFMGRKLIALSNKVDELDPIVKSLEVTRTALISEVDRVKLVATGLEASLATSTRLNEEQEKQLAEIGNQVVQFRSENTRLEETGLELSHQVEQLQKVQSALYGTLTTLTSSADAAKSYIEREEVLQTEQAKIVKQFQDLAAQEEGFAAREAELLRRLDIDVGRIGALLEEKKKRCFTLALRVVPLKIEVIRLTMMIDFIKVKNSELVEMARFNVRRRLLKSLV